MEWNPELQGMNKERGLGWQVSKGRVGRRDEGIEAERESVRRDPGLETPAPG